MRDATVQDQRFALAAEAAHVPVDACVFVLAALGYVIGLSLLSRGELIGVSGQWTLDNYARLREPQYFQVLVNSLRLAALTTAAVRPDRLPLRLPDGPAEAGLPLHRHTAAGGALLDQFPHPYLRLAHFAHRQRPHQYPADESGAGSSSR